MLERPSGKIFSGVGKELTFPAHMGINIYLSSIENFMVIDVMAPTFFLCLSFSVLSATRLFYKISSIHLLRIDYCGPTCVHTKV